jgi:hypothetical protein
MKREREREEEEEEEEEETNLRRGTKVNRQKETERVWANERRKNER